MLTLSDSFTPHLITAEQDDLAAIPLKGILRKVTEHQLVLLRGFKPLDKDRLVNYLQSQASLLQWDSGPVMEMQVDKRKPNYLFTEGDVPLHWDGAFHQEPRFLFFHCLKAPLPQCGGETLFVNTQRVWDTANAEQQAAWSDYAFSFKTEKRVHYGGAIIRRMVSHHPETGKTILRFAEPVGEDYLNPVDVQVLGKEKPDSDAILASLSQIMRAPLHRHEHRWQEGDYLIADNFALLHGRNAFSQHSPRHLRRIQIL
ncbi:TauD/TfdA family dioxygenase [Legionella sp. MW5194]|uniref:TauD/TfdA dioxygenase family protein n=1 Tax=Legionella sp. MW5194 TaxID=2662448 RepID=UPI00193EB289|nr:TauD/TfdA family dioxygenase [Legionella sp. MW5194]QRN04652.1 TauD/TfdA family dioxygenase [Legionella sp. MW5194]